MNGHRACVAAGHPRTAEAGAEVLRAGGNAVDAAIAAVAISFIAEPVLTGAGGGGFMLIREPDGRATLLDGFARMPRMHANRPAGARDTLDFCAVPVDFGDTVQTFYVGRASVAVPNLMRMLFDAHRSHGRMPIRDVLAPAMQAARDGVRLNALQASFIRLLTPILTREDECRRLHAPEGRPPSPGEPFRNPDLASTLEILALDGVDEMYRGDIARAVVASVSPGGLLTMRDMETATRLRREPVSSELAGGALLTNPPPSAGGVLIAFSLMLLERLLAHPSAGKHGLPWRILLAETMRAASLVRARVTRPPEAGADIPADILDESSLKRWLNSCLQHLEISGISKGAIEPSDRHGSTTHISVLDREGRAVSVTTSNGEGSGIVVPGTGLHLNNMLGEEDINPGGFHRLPAGATLPSMMAPSIFVRDGRPAMILGSGGSNRLRGAIMQALHQHVSLDLPVAEAVAAPRIHLENGVLDCEPGALGERGTALAEALGWQVRPWREPSVYFGGVHAIAVDANGGVQAGGDPRRGGAVAWA